MLQLSTVIIRLLISNVLEQNRLSTLAFAPGQ